MEFWCKGERIRFPVSRVQRLLRRYVRRAAARGPHIVLRHPTSLPAIHFHDRIYMRPRQ